MRAITCQDFPQFFSYSLIFYVSTSNSSWAEEFSISLRIIICSRQQGWFANLFDVNLSLFNLPTSLLNHYLQLSLTVTPSCASNRLCQFINPAAAVKTPLVYPWTMATDTGSEPATVRRQSRLFSLFFSPPCPTSAHRSPLLAKFKYMTQHCDSSDELCLPLQVSVSCSWQFHSLSFSDVCFSAARPFKGQWF